MSTNADTPLLPGISFKLLWHNRNTVSLFSNLLTVLIPSGICTVDGFMYLDMKLNVNVLSFTSECLGLKLGMLQFPNNFNHILYLNGQNHHPKYDTDVSFVIHSKLKTPQVNLGHFFEIYTSDFNSVAVEVIFNLKKPLTEGFIHNVNVSLFDSVVHVDEVSISGNYLTFQGDTIIFNHFPIHFVGQTSTENKMDSLPLIVKAEILDGGSGLMTTLSHNLNSHVRNELNLVLERLGNAQVLLDMANNLHIYLSSQYEKVKMEYYELLLELKSTNETYWESRQKAQNDRDIFLNSLNSIDLNTNCSDEFCTRICEDSYECSVCYSHSKLKEMGICETSLSKNRLINRYRQVPIQSWKYEIKCHHCWKIVWYLLPYYSPSNCCSTVSVPFTDYRNEPYQVYETFEQIQYESCITGEINANVSNHCCNEYQCAFKFHSFSCLSSDSLCLKEQQQRLGELALLDLQLKQEQYSRAKSNFTVSEIKLAKVESKLFIIKQELNLLGDAKKKAFDMKEFRKRTMSTLHNMTDVYNQLLVNSSYTNINFKILNISFDIVLTNVTPVAFPVTFLVEYNREVKEIDLIVNFQNPLELIYRQVSVNILDNIFGERGRLRVRREAITIKDKHNYFVVTCAEITNIQSFAEQVMNSSITFEQQLNYNLVSIDEMFLNFSLDLGNKEAETINHLYSDLEVEANMLTTRVQNLIENNSIVYWQNGQDVLYRNGGEINGYACVDQYDCLLTATLDLVFLLEDTPLEEAKSLGQELISFRKNMLNVKRNDSFIHANFAMKKLLEIISKIMGIGYWCSKPPVFVKHLPARQSVVAGETLLLSCVVQSDLQVRYHWTRNSKLLHFKTSGIVIPHIQITDAGEYQCIASNDAGSVSSQTSTVDVYLAPVFNQTLKLLYETFVGDDTGFTLTCDAYALPVPGWRWFYKSVLNEDWKEIENLRSNSLTFTEVLSDDEGYYACNAYNLVGSVMSESTYLRTLPAEVVTLAYPVTFVLNSHPTNTGKNQSTLPEVVDEIKRQLHLTSTLISHLQITDNLHISFALTTPHKEYDPNLSMQELVTVMTPLISQLEMDKEGLSLNVSSIIASIDGITMDPGTFHIGPRHFVCSDGYEVHVNQMLCGKLHIFCL